MGDYQPSSKLSPNGLKQTVQMIKKTGMRPGLWFEIDNIGAEAAAYHEVDHTFDGKLPELIQLPLPHDCPLNIERVYTDSKVEVWIEDKKLYYKPTHNMKGLGIYLKK